MTLIPSEPWHEIVPNLWMGGNRDEPRHDKFHAVLSLDSSGAVVKDGAIAHKEWYFHDGLMPEEYLLEDAVTWAWRHWMMGTPTLVRCQAGLNRSGLVVARLLIDVAWQGMGPHEVIELIREKRSRNALFNPAFREYLLGLPAARGQ